MSKTKMLSLSARKMEKNFIAVIEKNYERKPQHWFTYKILIKRLRQELKEFENAIIEDDLDNMMDELADLSNIIDYLYEKCLMELVENC